MKIVETIMVYGYDLLTIIIYFFKEKNRSSSRIGTRKKRKRLFVRNTSHSRQLSEE